MIIDTHAHLMFEDFEGEVAEVVERAQKNGVSKIVNIGCGRESSYKGVEMVKDFEELYATVGLHPYDADDLDEDLMKDWLKIAQSNKKIVGIGETGLDYFKSQVAPDLQKRSFARHLQLAKDAGLPVVVHNRHADEDALSVLRDFPEVQAVFHCYGSNLDFAKRVWSYGYMTSFTGIITFPNAEDLREVVKEVPLDLFMVETDCPYLAPQVHRGQRNEPAYVVEVVEMIAELKNLSQDEAINLAMENSLRFFHRI